MGPPPFFFPLYPLVQVGLAVGATVLVAAAARAAASGCWGAGSLGRVMFLGRVKVFEQR